jgi:hypothetical protein
MAEVSGTVLDGIKTDHGEHDAGRTVPVPATLARMIEAQMRLNGEDCELLSRPRPAAYGASATSTATSGTQLRKPPA